MDDERLHVFSRLPGPASGIVDVPCPFSTAYCSDQAVGTAQTSPDGRHLYVETAFSTRNRSEAVTLQAFAVDRQTLATTALSGPGACFANRPATTCASVRPLRAYEYDRDDALRFDPAGSTLFVVVARRRIAILWRDAQTGRLTLPAGRDACLVTGDPACRPTRGVRAPTGVAVSPDGRSLYIAGGRLAVFRLSSR
jgi:hypothetical protein